MLNKLIAARNTPGVGKVVHQVLALYGIELPSEVRIGKNFRIVHHGFGTVVHPSVTIGDNVTIFHQVTIGRYDAARVSGIETDFERIVIEDNVTIYPGAKIIGGPGVTIVGAGTVIGANAVLTRSTGENEVWTGIPARRRIS